LVIGGSGRGCGWGGGGGFCNVGIVLTWGAMLAFQNSVPIRRIFTKFDFK